MYLFFQNKDTVNLLLGREEENPEDNDSSENNSDDDSQNLSKTSSQLAREKDDDSPYFLMIALDSRFLAYLEDPRLVDPTEISERCDLFLENQVFKEIVKGEISRMF